MLGSLGDVIFVASHERLRTWSGMTRAGAPRVAEHEVIARKAKPEFLAPANEEISFTMRFDSAFGVQPLRELQQLRQYRDSGAILPLVIGGQYWGEWYIASLSEDLKHWDGRGQLLVAEVAVQLKEVPDETGSTITGFNNASAGGEDAATA